MKGKKVVMSILKSNGIDGLVTSNYSFAKIREKIIIDTDPGIGKNMHAFCIGGLISVLGKFALLEVNWTVVDFFLFG